MTLLAGLCSAPVWAGPDDGRLLPVDEASRDLSLVEARKDIQRIVQFREPEALAEYIYPRISNDKGVPNGVKHFVKHWRMDAQESELWDVLGEILKLGGGFLRSSRGVKFCAPYVFTHFPADLDIYGHGVVIADAVPLKKAASLGSRTLGMLSYHIVRVNDWRSISGPKAAWIKVTTLDGREGYVEKNKIRSPSDYHACFLLFERGWRLISLRTSD